MPPKNSNNKAAGSARPQTEVTDPPTPGPSRLTTRQSRDEDAPSVDTNADLDTHTNADPDTNTSSNAGFNVDAEADEGGEAAQPEDTGDAPAASSSSVQLRRRSARIPKKPQWPRHLVGNCLDSDRGGSQQPAMEYTSVEPAAVQQTASSSSASGDPQTGSLPSQQQPQPQPSSPLATLPSTSHAMFSLVRNDQYGQENENVDGNRKTPPRQKVPYPHRASSVDHWGRAKGVEQEPVAGPSHSHTSDHRPSSNSSPSSLFSVGSAGSQRYHPSSPIPSPSPFPFTRRQHAYAPSLPSIPSIEGEPGAGPSDPRTHNQRHPSSSIFPASTALGQSRKRRFPDNSDDGNPQAASQSSNDSEGYGGRDKGKGKAIFSSSPADLTPPKRARYRSPEPSPRGGDVSIPIGRITGQSGSGSYERPRSGYGREREMVRVAEGHSDDDGHSNANGGSQPSSQATVETESGNDGNVGQNATCGDVNVPNGNAAQTHTGIVEPSTFSQASQTTSDSDEDVESDEDEDEEEEENSTTDHSDVKSSEGLRGPSASQESTKPGFPPTNSSQTTSSDSTESSQSLLPYDEQTFETGGGGSQDVSSDESSLDVDPQADDGTFISPNASQGSGFEESQDASSTGNESGEGTSQEEGSGGQQSQASQTSEDSESDLIVVATAREEPKKVAKSEG